MLAGPNPKNRKLNPEDSIMIEQNQEGVQQMQQEMIELKMALSQESATVQLVKEQFKKATGKDAGMKSEYCYILNHIGIE